MRMILLCTISCIFLGCNNCRTEIKLDKVFLSKDPYGFRVVIDSIYVTTHYFKSDLNNIIISGFPNTHEEKVLEVEKVSLNADRWKISLEYESGIIPTFYFDSDNYIAFSSQSDSIQKEQLLSIFKEKLTFYFRYGEEKIGLEPATDYGIVIMDSKALTI